jgi:flavodoxin
MKTLVVYDTLYGNTEKIARAIAGAVKGEVKVLRASEASPADLAGVGLLFAGSPTQGGQATKAMRAFLEKVPADALKGVRSAAFDTRLKTKLVKLFGYAAGRIDKALKDKGAKPAGPGRFLVSGTRGPLADGEEERAAAWAKGIAEGRDRVTR